MQNKFSQKEIFRITNKERDISKEEINAKHKQEQRGKETKYETEKMIIVVIKNKTK